MTKKTISELSPDAKLLMERLEQCRVDDVVTYDELNKIVDRDLQKNGAPLRRARLKLQNEKQMVFDAVRNVGVKRLSDADIVATTAEGFPRKLRKVARRGIRRIASVQNFTNLNLNDQNRHNSTMSVLSVVDHIMHSSRLKRLEAKVAEAKAAISLNKTLELFSENGK